MKVDLVTYTPNPQEVIAECGRVCYLSEAKTPDANEKLIRHLRDMGHHSVLEHASATFDISGVSRALTHQLVRHRIASYSQQSQRYVDEKEFGYVTPKSVTGEAKEVYDNFIEDSKKTYNKLKEMGVPKEDARFVLPNACETRIRVTMNFRSLRHFIKLRSEKGAQWEIKELAQVMLEQLKEIAPAVFEGFIKKMDLMEQLCRASGVSGFESDIADIMKTELEKSSDKVYEDKFGNLVAVKGEGGPKIMICAHMDEIGLMIKHVTEDGYLNFVKIGGIDNRILLNQRVIIKNSKKDVVGIIGSKPPHLLQPEERKKVYKHTEMFIDIGAKNKKDALKKVKLGDSVILEPNYGPLSNNIYYGKAVDDRVGCFVLTEVMKKLPKNLKATVYAVGTTQEVGLKGARVAAYALDPDYCLAVDTTLAGDMPDVSEKESSLKLGKGPAITLMEASGRGVITHPKLRRVLEKTAEKKKIAYQIDILEGGMTDAAIVYMTREGIPSSTISIPTRYIHASSSLFHMQDVKNSVKLILAAITEIAKLK